MVRPVIGSAAPTAEIRMLHAVQRVAGGAAPVRAARALSLFGEHATGRLALGALGAGVDRPRRREWLAATSTTTAALLFGALLRRPLAALLVPPMLLARLVLGVHYPSDVLAGTVLGGLVALAARQMSTRRPS